MPEYIAPGVMIEEAPTAPRRIEGVSTSVCVFVGPTLSAPCERSQAAAAMESWAEFEQRCGGAGDIDTQAGPRPNYVAHAARAYFANGGRRLYLARTAADAAAADYAAALEAASAYEEVSIVAAPGYSAREDALGIQQVLLEHVRARDHGSARFVVLDAPPGATAEEAVAARRQAESSHAAIYHPWVVSDACELPLPPSGFICGVYARVDSVSGVWKAPANEPLHGVRRLAQSIDAREHDALNAAGVNCLRSFPERGVVVWGARTMSGDVEWKYVNVRRYVTYLERSMYRGLQWAAFEPNDQKLWTAVQQAVFNFLLENWRSGALMGARVEEAFFVKCDPTTMTRDDVDSGRLVVLIGVALLRPAEFVIFRIGLSTAARCEDC